MHNGIKRSFEAAFIFLQFHGSMYWKKYYFVLFSRVRRKTKLQIRIKNFAPICIAGLSHGFSSTFFSFIWCTYYLCNVFLHGQLRSIYVHSHIPTWRLSMLICLYPNDMYNSKTQLLSHTFAHLTGPSFSLKAILLPNKIVLGLT